MRQYGFLIPCVKLSVALAAFAVLSAWPRTLEAADAPAKTQGCPKDDSGLSLPAGFCATIFADGIGHARHLVVSSSNVVYVNTWSGRYYGNDKPHEGGFLVALKDTQGTGKADVIERFGETVQSGGAGGTGIGIYDGWLYAELNDKILKYAMPKGALTPTGKPEVVVSGLPLTGDHPMHPFVIDSKGDMYVDVASATNSCQEKNRTLKSPGITPCTELETRGGIWLYSAKKTNQVFSPAARYATGIRNGEGFGLDTAGHRIFVTQHGRDQLHTNWPEAIKDADQEATLPSEEVLLLKKGGDYGWPQCYYDPFQKALVLAPEYGGNGKTVGLCAQKTAPAAIFPAHWAPNGMLYYSDKGFPDRYRNGLFIAFHGSWNRAPYAQNGYNVVFQSLSGDGAGEHCEIFADGFSGADKTPAKAAHRPDSLALGPDGALYISDDVSGRVFRIVYQGGSDAAAAKTTACPSPTAGAGPIAAANALPPEGTHPDAGSETADLNAPPGSTPAMVARGNRVFHGLDGGATCTGCHGSDATGSTLGPNLVTTKWLWGDGSYSGIAATIAQGVAQPKQFRSPMPAMGGAQLSSDQVMAVSAYVWALNHRKAPAAAKPATTGELLIPGERIFPESITSSADGRVFIGSIGARRVFVAKPGAASAEPWTEVGAEAPSGVLGVFADDKSNTLWACYSAIGPNGAPSAAVAYELATAKLKARYPLPTTGAFCNDIAVSADGTVYVTDTSNNEIDRLKPGSQSLDVWAGNGAFGAKGAGVDGISILGNRIYINTLNTSKIFGVALGANGQAGAVTEIKLDRAIERPDGMRAHGGNILLVESGGPGRLSLLKIGGDNGQLITLKEGYPDGPVSVTTVGATAYVLEAQLKALRDPNSKTNPFRATAVSLGST
jgi:glucose/arabinose dehydrogenase/sugar lactone lactonase YvrE